MSQAHCSIQSSTDRTASLRLLLASIAVEEMAQAHIVNAEAEKIQYVLGTLDSVTKQPEDITVHDLFAIQDSVRKMMEDLLLREVMLQMKITDIMSALENSGMDSHTP